MLEAYREIARRRAAGERIALATVVAVKGSTPRDPGAKMAVGPDGRIAGTIGGGCGEAEVIQAALETIRTGQPRLLLVDLTSEVAADSGAVCGGVMSVFVEAVEPSADDVKQE